MNELYRYLTIAVTPEWRRLDPGDRAAHKREFVRAAEDLCGRCWSAGVGRGAAGIPT